MRPIAIYNTSPYIKLAIVQLLQGQHTSYVRAYLAGHGIDRHDIENCILVAKNCLYFPIPGRFIDTETRAFVRHMILGNIIKLQGITMEYYFRCILNRVWQQSK